MTDDNMNNDAALEAGSEEDFIKKLLQLVHKESIQRQTEVMNKISIKKK